MYFFDTKLRKEEIVGVLKEHPQYSYGKKDKTVMQIEDTDDPYVKNLHFKTEKDKPVAEGVLKVKDKTLSCEFLKRRNDFITAVFMVIIITLVFFGLGFGLGFFGLTKELYEKFIFAGIMAAVGFGFSLYLAFKYMRETKKTGLEVLENYLSEHLSVKKEKKKNKK